MEEEKDVYKLYDIDDICMLGNNVERDSVVFAAQDKQTQYKCAIRFFYTKPRPDYDQWCGEKVINSNREVLPYYPKNYMDFIGDPDLAFKDKLILMYTICKKMELYHKKGKIHGNIHPGNILVSSNRSTVELMDSLKEGNKNTFYCSPQLWEGIYHSASDVYALGLLFLEMLDLRQLEEEIITIKKAPCLQPLFPEEEHLIGVTNNDVKKVLQLMLHRNYKERITITEVIPILRDIILNLVHKDKKKVVNININYGDSYIQIPFCLLHEEKLEADQKYEKLYFNFHDDQYKLFEPYASKGKITFEKNLFKFTYGIKENELTIELSHPAGMKWKESFKEPHLPGEVRSRMGMRKMVIIMYHSPQEMFDICLSGKLIFRLSSQYESMFIKNL